MFFLSAVIYDGCPKTITQGIWWPRTKFNLPAAVPCPKGSVGPYTLIHSNMSAFRHIDMDILTYCLMSVLNFSLIYICHDLVKDFLFLLLTGAAIRHCDLERGWLEPDLYNCTSPPFVELNAAVCSPISLNTCLHGSQNLSFEKCWILAKSKMYQSIKKVVNPPCCW